MGDDVNILTRRPTGSSKFDLQLRAHDLRQLNSVLQTIAGMPKTERSIWLKANGATISQAFDQYVQETGKVLEEVTLDSDLLTISQDLLTSLRDTSDLLEGLLTPRNSHFQS